MSFGGNKEYLSLTLLFPVIPWLVLVGYSSGIVVVVKFRARDFDGNSGISYLLKRITVYFNF